jgi:hypothetical protein
LTKGLRDPVAHFRLNDGTTLTTSDYGESSRFASFVLLAELCAREVMRCEEAIHLAFLRGGGRP